MWYILRSWIKRNFSLRFDNSLHSVALYNRYLDASPSPMTILTDFNCTCMCSILLTRYIVFWIVDPYIGLEFLDWSYKKYSFCKVFLFRMYFTLRSISRTEKTLFWLFHQQPLKMCDFQLFRVNINAYQRINKRFLPLLGYC